MDVDAIKELAREYLKLETHPYFRDELEKVLDADDTEELNDRFYTSLSFGTGGLRGVIGGGYNRINPFMIQQATQGLANYVKRLGSGGSAVIAYDSRNFSDLFAEEAARVLCANDMHVWLFSTLRPTPELSFAVRELGATVGIVVTASHNPPEYNGYKVYWSDGGQIVPPHDKGIIEEVRSVGKEIRVIDKKDAESKGLLEVIDEKIDEPYRGMVKSCSLRPGLLKKYGKDLKVVFTPLHGTGSVILPQVLSEMGVEVIPVEEQNDPDGNFPTVEKPNPEESGAMKMALELGKRENADLVMGTDPDSDRLGIAVPNSTGELELVSGNQLGVLLADYIFSTRKELGTLPEKPAFVKTIVTTDLQRLIAEAYGAASYDVLTGFKYIAEKIKEFESTGETYIFGGEESYGYLVTDRVRDKDAVSAAFVTAEMALYHRTSGKTLIDRLEEIYETYGYFEEILLSRTFKGQKGKASMDALMKRLRENPPQEVGGIEVRELRDYKEGKAYSSRDGSLLREIKLPASDVMQFVLEDETIVTARPSGTEPKIKFYASCRGGENETLEKARISTAERLAAIEKTIDSWISESS
ncbi:MAG: phospho-sugar mutase [Spirochaetaceae bacterium]